MQRRDLVGKAASAAMLGGTMAAASAPGPASSNSAAPDAVSLDATLRPYLERHGLPALAAGVVQQGRIVAAGAVGSRRAGADIPVTIQDRFHIGSDTKAMTSLIAAMFVEEGRLRWASTPGEIFPDLAAGMDVGLRDVTLVQLLSHTSGLPSDDETFVRLMDQATVQDALNLDEMRLWMVRQWSVRPLQAAPGTRFAYSNMGYVIVGAMLERVAAKTWEELIVERVFGPLELRSAGLGPQASLGQVDAPLGHRLRPDGTLKPMLAGPNGDSSPVIGPAGIVHLSILDFARWAGWNAGEGRRGPALVRPETLRKLHTQVIGMQPRPDAPPGTPGGGGYALGWGITHVPYAAEPFVAHAGSNQMNLASAMLLPARDWGLVMTTNLGGERADRALLELAEDLYGRFGPGR